MTLLARFFSWITLPLFAPLYALMLVMFIESQPRSFLIFDSLYHYPVEVKYSFLYLFLIFIVLAPGLSMLMLRFNKSISSLSLDVQHERQMPIAIMTFYCIVLYGMMIYQEAFVPRVLKAMAFGGFISSFSAFWINRRFKISLHAIGAGALFGFVFGYFLEMEYFKFYVLIAAICFGVLTVTARLVLEKHSLQQLFYGYLLGFCSQLITMYFYPA
jgi:membrane-associated phospholipid phosphatase